MGAISTSELPTSPAERSVTSGSAARLSARQRSGKQLGCCMIHHREKCGMATETGATGLTRRMLFLASAAGFAGAAISSAASASDDADNDVELIKRLTGKIPVESDRLHLTMPRTFPNGYTVPLGVDIDSPMTENDYIRYVRLVAPRNPLIEVATFHFVAQHSQPRVSTRIRLAEPQYVLAFAEQNDGTLLMTKTWVEVATNGCA
jgi:sulfur-oxidizing protein SoxY